MAWKRVTKRNPCPICEKPDGCMVTTDGELAWCIRIESTEPMKSWGWKHRLKKNPFWRRPVKRAEPKIERDFCAMMTLFHSGLTPGKLQWLSENLGLSYDSIDRMEVGWDGKNYAFPMRDGKADVIGIRLRTPEGRKFCVTGSKNGLFIPLDLKLEGTLFICEGPTDTAAMLDLGCDAIGRPSCMCGAEQIIEFLTGRWLDVVVVSDNDAPKLRPDGSTWRPGQEGAIKLARDILRKCKSVKVMSPPHSKDIREAVRCGMTLETVWCLVHNRGYIT